MTCGSDTSGTNEDQELLASVTPIREELKTWAIWPFQKPETILLERLWNVPLGQALLERLELGADLKRCWLKPAGINAGDDPLRAAADFAAANLARELSWALQAFSCPVHELQRLPHG